MASKGLGAMIIKRGWRERLRGERNELNERKGGKIIGFCVGAKAGKTASRGELGAQDGLSRWRKL